MKTVSQIDLEIDEMNDIYPSTKEDMELVQSIITGIRPCYFQIVRLSSFFFFVPQPLLDSYERYQDSFKDVISIV